VQTPSRYPPSTRRRRGWPLAIVALTTALLLPVSQSFSEATKTPAELLAKADSIKTTDHSEFMAIVASLRANPMAMSDAQRDFLRYLDAWKNVYDGEYDVAIPALRSLTRVSDSTLRFRAIATLVNVLAFANHNEEAFVRLGELLDLLPEISHGDAREQGLGVAGLLYNQAGEYDLGLEYAGKIIEENWAGRGECKGGQLRLEALSKRGRLQGISDEFQATIQACESIGESMRANLIRIYVGKLLIAQERVDEAIKLLQAHYPQVVKSGSPRLTSEFDSLLAIAYRETGNSEIARRYALQAVENGVKNQYTEPLVAAYRLLYVLAKEQGNSREALAYHEQYRAADKGYLDDETARQLAFQRVSHAALADKLRIDTLNKENQVLQLQRALDKKAVETSGLYIALLILVLVSIAFWAYRTKRSQLHFMRLSQLDGLTGIANRPRFIELAQSALENGRRAQQEVCVVLCDLDHFKLINDKHGHAAGDFVLKQAVAACQMHLRTSDIFGRFGGEEFGIVLPGCSVDDARLRAEQLRLAIAAISGNYEGVELNVSASFGIASSAHAAYELRQLLAHADAALYRAKHAGRNCVVADEARRNADAYSELSASGFGRGSADVVARVKTTFLF
jgi:diguanylate cyclase (GGDEF)-like protein